MRIRSVPRRAVAVLLAVAVLGACRGSSSDAVKLDGSPRVPDQEGIVASVDRHEITLDGKRSYALSPKLAAFSTYNRHTISVLGTKGDYVQLGVRGRTVEWLARIGPVSAGDASNPVVLYQGRLKSVKGERLDFSDGTVLRLQKDLKVTGPVVAGESVVAINARSHRVQGIRLPSNSGPTTTQ